MPYEVKYRVAEQRPYVNINFFQRWNPSSFPSVYKDHRASSIYGSKRMDIGCFGSLKRI